MWPATILFKSIFPNGGNGVFELFLSFLFVIELSPLKEFVYAALSDCTVVILLIWMLFEFCPLF